MIYDFLNNKNSTRFLSDDEFERILPILAKELKTVDYHYKYTDDQLRNDWKNLVKRKFDEKTTSSVRVGMKLCEHFFPNFYDIRNKGKKFGELWNDDENLMKILRWNRKSHSTPYLSELKRGIYFCCGLTKSTMFRPHLAKVITSTFKGDTVLDPCAGWGGRLLGTVSNGKKYIGFEPCTETFENLKRMVDFLGIQDSVTLYNMGSEYIDSCVDQKVDIVLTSPPYYDLEIYSNEKSQSVYSYSSYDEWLNKWLKSVIKMCIDRSNVSCWNVHNVGKMNMIDDVKRIHEKFGFGEIKRFSLMSSKRQTNKSKQKNSDFTICYSKKS